MHLKRLAAESIPSALEKALRYRLLNEPAHAESICRDILEVDPTNQSALVTLLLALTDQFSTRFTQALEQANGALARLEGDYEKAYYEGIIHERWANTEMGRNMPGDFASGWYREAMRCYEKAEQLSSTEDPDAVLRWNTCARLLQEQPDVAHGREEATHDVPGDPGDVPMR